MGINFGDMGSTTTVSSGVAQTTTETGGFTLDLEKGVLLDLTKKEPGLKNIVFAAGWDANTSVPAFDLDVSAILLDGNGKVHSASDIIFFNHLTTDGIALSGDSRTGAGEGDDETIKIELDKISSVYQRIDFVINIFEAATRRQTFGSVKNSYCRILNSDQNDKEICRFRLKDDYSTSTAVIVASLIRNGEEWDFKTVGEGKVVASLNDIAAMYM
jgi:tellurium resistance protein TerD